MRLENNKLYFEFETCLLDNNYIYYTELNYPALFCYDLNNDTNELVCEFAEENGDRFFGAIVKCDNYLYLIPNSASCAYYVNLQTKDYGKIQIPEPKNKIDTYVESSKFLDGYEYNNKIYMIPSSYPGIVVYDRATEKLTVFDDWIEDVKKHSVSKDNAIFRKTKIRDGVIYAPFCRSNLIYKFVLDSLKYEVIGVGSSICNFSDIEYDGKNFWLAPRNNGPIVKWCEENGTCEEFKFIKENSSINRCLYGNLFFYNNKMILFPQLANETLIFDNDKFKIWDEIKNISHMNYVGIYENDLLFFSLKNGYLYRYNEDKEELEIKKLQSPDKLEKHIKLNYQGVYKQLSEINENDFLTEKSKDDILYFVNYVIEN